MKKSLIITFAIACALCLCACASDIAEPQGGNAGIANPMHEMESLDALNQAFGIKIKKPSGEELTNEAFFKIDGEPALAEYRFTCDGKSCFVRYAKAGENTDICGIYGENGTLFSGEESRTHYIETDEYKVQRWFIEGGQFVFAVNDGGEWSLDDFNKLCTVFIGSH